MFKIVIIGISCIGFISIQSHAQTAVMSSNILQKFAISPDKQLSLYASSDCQYQAHCQFFYQAKGNTVQTAIELYRPTTGFPQVKWHGNIAQLTALSGTDTTQDIFIDAQHGVYQVINLAQFDPKHQCLIASYNHGKQLAFFRLFQYAPTEIIDLGALQVDAAGFFPINSLAMGGGNKFLANGDFELHYFKKNVGLTRQIIKQPCYYS